MLGVRIGTLMVTPHNGDRILVEPLNGRDCIVRIPRSWGEAWLARAAELNAAVEEAQRCQPSVPEPDLAA